MKSKKKEDFDYQSFEQAALKAMYEGKPLEQALGPLLKITHQSDPPITV